MQRNENSRFARNPGAWRIGVLEWERDIGPKHATRLALFPFKFLETICLCLLLEAYMLQAIGGLARQGVSEVVPPPLPVHVTVQKRPMLTRLGCKPALKIETHYLDTPERAPALASSCYASNPLAPAA